MIRILMVCQKLDQRHQAWYLVIGKLLYAIGVDRKAILLGVVLSQGGNLYSKETHIRETRVPWGECPVPKGIIKGR